jgi:uncharacterized protein DUF4157
VTNSREKRTTPSTGAVTRQDSGLSGRTKLTVGPVSDPMERKAEQAADEVAHGVASRSSSAASQTGAAETATAGEGVPASVTQALNQSGRPLDAPLRADMERRFGHDFARVRIHTDSAAARSAQEIEADAYTLGNHVVFGPGRFASQTNEGRHLIAHELAHVVQHGNGGTVVRRQVYGPKATATPADWKDKVANATSPTDRAALIESIVSPVKVVDKTTDAASDKAVDPNHCVKWDDAKPTVSYDDGLNSKSGRSSDAGFTKEITSGPATAKKTEFFIVLGPKALDAKDRTTTTVILNHEFDHVRGTRAGSTLRGDDSEVETWTNTFVREFHLSYIIRDRDGTTSYVDPSYRTFTQLGKYYERSTNTTVKSAAVQKIADYYNATIKPHAVHDRVFRYWLHRGINALGIAAFCGDINDKLGKIVDPSKDVKDYWEMPTSIVKAAKFAGPPAVQVP